ncbi:MULTISPECIES: glutathione S-transferase [unclassified Chelatococcus]|uniref:glutathione S-transferase n=1 Tax=unclassified Chelatococcus TaxID=2638111 RepID=UPI000303034E|nr:MULTISPECIES: glutathione S-transferase [unclassified Chelatococcus]ALA20391.1 glutathione S-transferase [Chelatococcus sp. CO-6]
MTAFQLFHSTASPYVRKVLVSAHEKGVADAIALLPSAAGPVKRDATIVAHNPSGKVPTALLPDGSALYDSRVICAYVDSLAEAPRLLPAEGAERFRVLTLEALADSMLDAALLCRYETVLRPEALRWDAWYAGQMEKIDSGLAELSQHWLPLLEGPINAGSIAAACALGYLDFRFADKDWRGPHPALARWYATFAERPSMQATRPH